MDDGWQTLKQITSTPLKISKKRIRYYFDNLYTFSFFMKNNRENFSRTSNLISSFARFAVFWFLLYSSNCFESFWDVHSADCFVFFSSVPHMSVMIGVYFLFYVFLSQFFIKVQIFSIFFFQFSSVERWQMFPSFITVTKSNLLSHTGQLLLILMVCSPVKSYVMPRG